MIKVFCLDDQSELHFFAKTPYEAMEKLIYTLNLSHLDKNARIELCNGRTLSVQHNGKTYGCIIRS